MSANLQPARVGEWYREEPGALQRTTTDAAIDHVARRTVVVGLFDHSFERGIRRGTGTCIIIGGRYFVATAGHHFVNVPEPYRVGVMPLTTEPSRDIFLATAHHGRGGAGGDQVDVAWLELAAADAVGLGRDFITLDDILPHYAEVAGEPIFSYGFPDYMEITPRADGQTGFGFAVQGYATIILDPMTIEPRFRPDPAFDIFARYSTSALDGPLPKGRIAKLPDAPGLSGGGFWRLNIGKRGVWTPHDLKLVGIEHEWWPQGEWFRASRIYHWLRLVADDQPELRLEIEAALRTTAPTT
jgi:hypothetical protein